MKEYEITRVLNEQKNGTIFYYDIGKKTERIHATLVAHVREIYEIYKLYHENKIPIQQVCDYSEFHCLVSTATRCKWILDGLLVVVALTPIICI